MSKSALVPWSNPGELPYGPAKPPPRWTPNARGPRNEGPLGIIDPHRYAKFSGEILVSVPQTSGGVLVLAAPDTYRNALILRNTSATANIFVAFGSNANLNSVVRLTPNTMVFFDTVVPQDDVYAIADAASGTVVVAQSVVNY